MKTNKTNTSKFIQTLSTLNLFLKNLRLPKSSSFFTNSGLVLACLLQISISSTSSASYLSLNETAEILPDGYFTLGVAPQLRLSDGGGIDVSAFFDTSVASDTNMRISLGGGKVDFWTSASLKWVPFPDVGRQPAMGLKGALIYARDEDTNFYNFQFSPIISKLADTTYGKMIPYIGLPVTYVTTKDSSFVSTQLAVGAEWFSSKDLHFGAEFNLNLSKSFTSLSGFVSFPFDQAVGYKK